MTLEQAKANLVTQYGLWDEIHTAYDEAHIALRKLGRKCIKADRDLERVQEVYLKLEIKGKAA
jgi:hypothetical protein